VVAGNYVGTAADGLTALPNAGNGLDVKRGATRTRIGTNADGINDAAERNVISGNGGSGMIIWNNSTTAVTNGNVIAGNFIGTDKTGARALANGGDGVSIFDGVYGNPIGGTAGGAGHVNRGNRRTGVALPGEPPG